MTPDPLDSRIVERLVHAILRDPDATVRRAALRAVVRLPLPPESWIAVASSVYYLLRAGVFSLEHRGEPPLVPLVDAIEASAFVPVRQVRHALQRIVSLEDPVVRRTAAHALSIVGDPAGVPALVDALDDADPFARYEAAKDIYRLRAHAAEFGDALRMRCSNDGYGSVRFWLALSLTEFGDDAPIEDVFQAVDRGDCDLVELFKNPDETRHAGRVPTGSIPVLERIAANQAFDNGLRHVAEDLLAQSEFVLSIDPPSEPATAERTAAVEEILAELERGAAEEADAAVMAVDFKLTEALNLETGARFTFDTHTLFKHYQRLKRYYGPRMHLAWMVSRTPVSGFTSALSERLDSPDAAERADAMELIELSARYRETARAPYFGGGGDAPEASTSPEAELDFRDHGLSEAGIPPGYVGGVDPWQDPVPASAPTKKRAKPPARESKTDEVRLGASSLGVAKPGDRFVAAFAAYVPALESQVLEEMRKRSRHSEPQLDMKTCRWKRGAAVTVVASGEHLTIDPPVEEFVWESGRVVLSFEVAIDGTAPAGSTVLKFSVFIVGARVAMLPLEIKISASPGTPCENHTSAEPARTGFASYSSADQLRVLDRVTEIRNTAGIDIFEDCLDLRPGEEWKPALEREIRQRDVFFLFWSENAKASQWVDWEWRTALQEKGIEAIALRPLQPMDQAPPPEELTGLHANDPLMIIRQYYENRNARR